MPASRSLSRSMPALAGGVFFVAALAYAARHVSHWDAVSRLGISPLIVAMAIGAVGGNTLHRHLPRPWLPGILFCSKTLLRVAVVFFGFRITFQDIAHVGVEGLTAGALVLATTFLLGAGLGIRAFGLPPRIALLIAAGSSVCGAAAVLATEPVVRGRPHESSVAIGTVVIFGTLGMFLYPLAFASGLLDIDAQVYGLFAGATLHEVAHVVAAARTVSEDAANAALIVKMARVMLLIPLLALLAVMLAPRCPDRDRAGRLAGFPWFALGFVLCAGFNSLHLLPAEAVAAINDLDGFALTMAMCALGLETRLDKVRSVGAGAFALAAILALWLAVGGYWLTVLTHRLLGAA